MEGRGAPELFPKSGNPCKMICWWGLEGNGLAQRPPGYPTIHFPRTNPPQPPWGTTSSTKSCFPGSRFCPQKVPGPARTQIQIPGSKNVSRGQTYQSCILKNHAECNGRYSKRSHMLQVTGKKHPGPLRLNLGQSPHGVGDSPWRIPHGDSP